LKLGTIFEFSMPIILVQNK
jgi:hypothetical protein